MIEARIIAGTTESSQIGIDGIFTLGGKIAGVCYGKGDYSIPSISSEEAGARRAHIVAKSGHHSCFEHGFITIEFRNIPKLIAMLLNSIGFYATSEKSARYTDMVGIDEHEEMLYNKWKIKMQDLIVKEYPEMPAQMVEKMALENARYMLSVMVDTHMVYTTSYNNWCYLRDWFRGIAKKLSKISIDEATYSIYKFYTSCLRMISILNELGISEEITDKRKRNFEFIMGGHNISHEYFGDTYCFIYDVSLAILGHEERHRVSVCNIQTDKKANNKFYVPTIIKGTELEAEWVSDLESLSDNIPQATLVKVAERGITERYTWKMQERLCGRAMNEIKDITASCLEKLVNSDKISPDIREKSVDIFTDDRGQVIPRCKTKEFTCNEGCFWGSNGAICRKV